MIHNHTGRWMRLPLLVLPCVIYSFPHFYTQALPLFSIRWSLSSQESPYTLIESLLKFPYVAFEFETIPMLVWLTTALSHPFKVAHRLLRFLCLSLLVFNGVKPWLCLWGVSQAPRHFKSSQTQATCNSCFACQFTYSFISIKFPACTSTEVSGWYWQSMQFILMLSQPCKLCQGEMDTDHCPMAVQPSHATFHRSLTKYV